MFRIFNKNTSSDELRVEVNALRSLIVKEGNKDGELLEHFYRCLTVIDNKISAILTLNSILIITLIFLHKADLDYFQELFLFGGFVFVILSFIGLFIASNIFWPEANSLEKDPRVRERKFTKNEVLLIDLLRTRNGRTEIYRLSRLLTMVGFILLMIAVSVEVFPGAKGTSLENCEHNLQKVCIIKCDHNCNKNE